jgi:xanthine dehydrogenase accessory factor
MHELAQILAPFEQLCAEGKTAALATVVAVAGSSYRRPGARMLIAEDGRTWGGVSGGCLERDVARRGRGVIASGTPVLARYDTAEDADSAYVAPPGCRGVIDVFVQPLSAEASGPMPVIARVLAERRSVRLATVLRTWGRTGVTTGTHIAESNAQAAPTTESDEAGLIAMIEAELAARSAADPTAVRRFERSNEESGADVFFETIRPPQSLVIFGAGYDAAPLVQVAKAVGWHVTVVGMRPATGMRERFPTADVLLVGTADDPAAGLTPEPDAAVVLVTHNYPIDVKVLATLARQPLPYVGILGPRYRSEQLLAEMPPDALPRGTVYAPVGLDIGADNPQAIALAIVAEIQAVLARRPAGFLRDRPGPIYARLSQDPGADSGTGSVVREATQSSDWVEGERACPTPA